MVQKAFIRCVNATGNAEIARYDLSEDGSTESAIDLRRGVSQWRRLEVQGGRPRL